MSRTAGAAAAALLTEPAVAIRRTVVQPTLSDHPAARFIPLTTHRSAAIAALALNTTAVGGV